VTPEKKERGHEADRGREDQAKKHIKTLSSAYGLKGVKLRTNFKVELSIKSGKQG